jgi:hypothetical protein
MKKSILPMRNQGFAIALAWPQTTCKQAGGWYDGLMTLMGYNREYFYKAGHAATVLIDPDGKCFYFDFGRYHSPFGYGRVRSADTDHDLQMTTKAIVSHDGKKIENLEEIMLELLNREACHGTGPLYGSLTEINFDKAYAKALELQDHSPIPYGPFLWNGCNCSRFVYTVIRKGLPFSWKKILFAAAIPTTPTTLTNVKNLGKYLKLNLTDVKPVENLPCEEEKRYA